MRSWTPPRQLGYESGDAAVHALWEWHREAFLDDLRGLIAQTAAPVKRHPEDEKSYGEPMSRAELAAFLCNVAAYVEAGQSLVGSLEYHPCLTGATFALAAPIHVGDSQGSMVLYPRRTI